jgi:hypothetical protein
VVWTSVGKEEEIVMKLLEGVRGRGAAVRGRGKALICAAALLASAVFSAPPAAAQDLSEEDVITLGLLGEELLARGIDGSSASQMADVLELSWAYGLSGLEATPGDAWGLVQESQEDSNEINYLITSLRRGRALEPKLLRVRQKLTCEEARWKAEQARRVAKTLRRVSGMYGAGLTLLGAGSTILGQAVPRFTWPLAFGAVVTGTIAGFADDLANAYANAPCDISGGGRWIRESIRAGAEPVLPTSRWASPPACALRSGWSPVG